MGDNRIITPIADRFWAKVDTSPGHGPEGTCWVWTGATSGDGYGYGRIRVGGKPAQATRVSWELANGPIPPGTGHHGTCVLHICDHPPCVNPAHLRLGSAYDNAVDRDTKGRLGRRDGPHNSRAVVTEEDVRAIRAFGHLTLAERAELAPKLGLSVGGLDNIIYRKTWKHV